jgi:hypothetical protein
LLRRKLSAALGNWGIPVTEMNLTEEAGAAEHHAAQPGSILHTRVQRIALRHCEADSKNLCIDVAVRARVIDAKSSKAIYDGVLYYNHGSNTAVLPYELPAYSSERTSGCEVEAICGEKGTEIFHGEIARALDAIVRELTRDFGLRPE